MLFSVKVATSLFSLSSLLVSAAYTPGYNSRNLSIMSAAEFRLVDTSMINLWFGKFKSLILSPKISAATLLL
jgi:hypothetical protein